MPAAAPAPAKPAAPAPAQQQQGGGGFGGWGTLGKLAAGMVGGVEKVGAASNPKATNPGCPNHLKRLLGKQLAKGCSSHPPLPARPSSTFPYSRTPHTPTPPRQVMKGMEAAEEAKRLQRANDAVFLSLLRDRVPPINSRTTYEDLEQSSSSDPRWVGSNRGF